MNKLRKPFIALITMTINFAPAKSRTHQDVQANHFDDGKPRRIMAK
jgi:hypothetical protein